MSPKRLGKVLKQRREKKGMTQAALAEKVGVGQTYIAKLESGDKKNPTLDLLKKLAKTLGVPVTELLGGGYYNDDEPTAQGHDSGGA
jgi:XRE family transcriptional regulator of biofilm formation